MKFAALLAGLLSITANARKIETKIMHIQEPISSHEAYEIFVTHNGRVYEVAPEQTDLLEKLYIAKHAGEPVRLKVEEGEHFELLKIMENVVEVEGLSQKSQIREEAASSAGLTPLSDYTPSNVESVGKATAIFNRLYDKTKWFSQCFNRAHVWSKQMNDFYGVKSMKILIYYTQKYRKEVDKKWWFHIAPMVKVNDGLMVMDREFTSKPTDPKTWEKKFTAKMENPGYDCKKITNISEYYEDSNYYNEYCNIQHVSMYYWEPSDLEKLEKEGRQKNQWINWEVKAAAKEAFRGWRDIQDRHAK